MSFLVRLYLQIISPRSVDRLSLLKSYKNIKNMSPNREELRRKDERIKAQLLRVTNECRQVLKAREEQAKLKLRKENAELMKKVNNCLAELTALETTHGKKQISVPKQEYSTDGMKQEMQATPKQVTTEETVTATEPKKPAKEKKPKKEKAGGGSESNAAAATTELAIDVGRLDMRVGKIVEVQRHPEADSLYLEKIDLGEAQPRTVISGLVKFVPIEEMQNRMVVVLCNLKPAKMRGVMSEGMVMCASTPERVEVLSPPEGSVPGDLVHCEGYNRQPDVQLNPKKKIFETCAPDLKTNDALVACYKSANLYVPGKGNIMAQTLKNVQVK